MWGPSDEEIRLFRNMIIAALCVALTIAFALGALLF
jgi:hypothetical protein